MRLRHKHKHFFEHPGPAFLDQSRQVIIRIWSCDCGTSTTEETELYPDDADPNRPEPVPD